MILVLKFRYLFIVSTLDPNMRIRDFNIAHASFDSLKTHGIDAGAKRNPEIAIRKEGI